MLEDDFTWVLRKALKGHALAPSEAARRAGLADADVLAFSRGRFSGDIARKLADALGLRAGPFALHEHYEPKPLALAGVTQLALPYSDSGVNAWLIQADGASLLFDTGNDATSCLEALDGTLPDQVFITHGHHDHVAGIHAFASRGIPVHGPALPEATSIARANQKMTFGSLTVTPRALPGHANPALGYVIEGLAAPVLVAGDALFAGSAGGCDGPDLYQLAMRSLREVLAPLPDDTVILTGHGPATTVGEEKARNPFPVF